MTTYLKKINTDKIDYLHVMQRLEDTSSQKELASEVGFSVRKVNYIIKAESFLKSSNKQAYKYALTSDGLKNKILLTEKYIAIKKLEYEKLQENLEFDIAREKC